MSQHRIFRHGVTCLVTLASLLVTDFIAPGLTRAEMRGRCVLARVPEPMILPDESHHPAGTIRLCLHEAYTPDAGLHRTYINGQAKGLFISRKTTSEGQLRKPDSMVLFQRTEKGLMLAAYTVPLNDHRLIYWFDPPKRRLTTAVKTLDVAFQREPEMIRFDALNY